MGEQEQRRLKDEEEDNEDVCADFQTFAALSAAGKRALLAEKHCGQEDQVAVDDIYRFFLPQYCKNYRVKFSTTRSWCHRMVTVTTVVVLRVRCSMKRT